MRDAPRWGGLLGPGFEDEDRGLLDRALPVVTALAPYDAQVAQVNRRIGSIAPGLEADLVVLDLGLPDIVFESEEFNRAFVVQCDDRRVSGGRGSVARLVERRRDLDAVAHAQRHILLRERAGTVFIHGVTAAWGLFIK